ncbi:techylectin-5A-like [Amphibalanus amphitrite]|uniref:techylectin-5A-like n=1 Tax=Amphibalanus amphitrite TaxID=1232801 RepID=UPI001C901BB7|nr:techylectin-5A-like [Amphibalanus amphitrite]
MKQQSLLQLVIGVLLTLLLAAPPGARCSDPAPGEDATLVGTLDQLWTFLERVERKVSISVSKEVSARLDGLQTRLKSHVNSITRRLDGQEEQLGRLGAQLGNLSERVDDASRQGSVAPGVSQTFPRDCSDLPAGTTSGAYLLQPGLDRSVPPTPAYCDLESDGGGWTVVQRRDDIPPREDFYRGWQDYKQGFGEFDGEFWWGLESLWRMTSPRDRRYELRVDLWDFDGSTRHAVYSNFRVASEIQGYALTIGNYTGDAGDSLSFHRGMQFTTNDVDNDIHEANNCAHSHEGAWWYKNCHRSNLNGRYLGRTTPSKANGVSWFDWRGHDYSLKTVTMKIRPTKSL